MPLTLIHWVILITWVHWGGGLIWPPPQISATNRPIDSKIGTVVNKSSRIKKWEKKTNWTFIYLFLLIKILNMQIFDEFWEKIGFSSKIMRNDRISSGFSVKILSNDVIHHIHVFMVIKNITNLHKLCKYAYMQIFLLYFIVFILMYSIVFIGFCFCFFRRIYLWSVWNKLITKK